MAPSRGRTHPVDLRKLGWNFDPEQVAAALSKAKKLPNLANHAVVFSGLGVTAGNQPEPPISARAKLNELWLAICKAAKALSCSVATGDLSSAPSHATNSVPLITVSVDETPCSKPVALPAGVLFGGDSPALSPSADATLSLVASELTRCPDSIHADVIGHAADTHPGQMDGLELSQERADNVRNRLVALGAPATIFGTVQGVGDSQPLVDNWVNGKFDEALAEQNRRVDIIFH